MTFLVSVLEWKKKKRVYDIWNVLLRLARNRGEDAWNFAWKFVALWRAKAVIQANTRLQPVNVIRHTARQTQREIEKAHITQKRNKETKKQKVNQRRQMKNKKLYKLTIWLQTTLFTTKNMYSVYYITVHSISCYHVIELWCMCIYLLVNNI